MIDDDFAHYFNAAGRLKRELDKAKHEHLLLRVALLLMAIVALLGWTIR